MSSKIYILPEYISLKKFKLELSSQLNWNDLASQHWNANCAISNTSFICLNCDCKHGIESVAVWHTTSFVDIQFLILIHRLTAACRAKEKKKTFYIGLSASVALPIYNRAVSHNVCIQSTCAVRQFQLFENVSSIRSSSIRTIKSLLMKCNISVCCRDGITLYIEQQHKDLQFYSTLRKSENIPQLNRWNMNKFTSEPECGEGVRMSTHPRCACQI